METEVKIDWEEIELDAELLVQQIQHLMDQRGKRKNEFTIREYAEAAGLGYDKARLRINALKDAGGISMRKAENRHCYYRFTNSTD